MNEGSLNNKVIVSHFSGKELPLKSLSEPISLCGKDTMCFHWSDSVRYCEIVESNLSTDTHLFKDYQKRKIAISNLKKISVWIKSKKKIIETTVYDLYDQFLLSKDLMLNDLDPYFEYHISFLSASGPFKKISIVSCFNESLFYDFKFIYLIENLIPRGDFSLRLRSKVLIEYGENFDQVQIVGVNQIGHDGILISIPYDLFLNEISHLDKLRILLNSSQLRLNETSGLNDLKENLGKYSFNLLYTSKKSDSAEIKLNEIVMRGRGDFFTQDKRVFLLIPYSAMEKSHSQMANDFRNFSRRTCEVMDDFFLGPKQFMKTA